MAQVPSPLPPTDTAWTQSGGAPTQSFRGWASTLDAALRAFFGQATTTNTAGAPIVGPLPAVASPSNANAKAAGVPVNGLYTSTANPAIVYVRTA